MPWMQARACSQLPTCPLRPIAPRDAVHSPETMTNSSPASPLTPKKPFPTTTAAGDVAGPSAPAAPQLLGGRISPCPPTAEVTGGGHDAGVGGLSPSLPAGICSPPCLSPGCYQSLLRKDSTQDSSRSDFSVLSSSDKAAGSTVGGQTKPFIIN